MPRRRRAWSCAVTLLALVVLAFLAAATIVAAPAPVNEVAWATDTLSGDFAVRLELEFTQLTTCTLLVAGTGPMRAHDLVLYLGRSDDPEVGLALLLGGTDAINVGPLGFQHSNTQSNEFWLGAVTANIGFVPGTYPWVFAGFGLQGLGVPHPITDHAFELKVTCDRAFTVASVEAAREAFGASNVNLEEGVGARIAAAGGSANANLADGVVRTPTGPSTFVLARDVAASGVSAGLLVHIAPDDLAVVPAGLGTLAYVYHGPPGTQRLHIDYAGAGSIDLYLMVIGYRPVAGIAALDGWAGLPTY